MYIVTKEMAFWAEITLLIVTDCLYDSLQSSDWAGEKDVPSSNYNSCTVP